jgi:hypothetical protein
MSDDLKDDFPGATKALLASFGLMLLFVGGEMIAEKEGLRIGIGAFILLLGCACFLSAWFSKSVVKHVLKDDAQRVINDFSRSRIVWGGVIFLLFETLLLSRFVEEHRWPFSYPADPRVEADNVSLHNEVGRLNSAIGAEKELADKWRFISALRNGPPCNHQMRMTARASSTLPFWRELFQNGGWSEKGALALAPSPGSSSSITIRIKGDAGISAQCAGALQRALTDIYPNPPSKIASNQQSDFLSSCPDCVQIEMDY